MSTGPAAPPPFSQARIASLPIGWQAVAYTVLSDGMLAVLGADVDLAAEQRRVFDAMQAQPSDLDVPSRIAELVEGGIARIWTVVQSEWADGPTFPLETPYPSFDRFSDGRWLVPSARTDNSPNARVIAPSGDLLQRFTLGDGIQHVGIDATDRIWVGWFDEGIFGNDDWRVPGLEWPPSSNGVACFAMDGSLLPLPVWPEGVDSIADCYALNTVGGGSWICPYEEFPLVRFAVGEPTRWWRSDLAGPSAIAVDGSYALIAGGYRAEANRLALVSLDGAGRGENARLVGSWRMPLRPRPAANEWEPVWDPPTLLTGRGDVLHLVSDGVWYRWRVADCAAASLTADADVR